MGDTVMFTKTALVMGVLCSHQGGFAALLDRLRTEYGPIAHMAGPFPFTFTTYYDDEMGTPIDRYFIMFNNLVDPASLASIKQVTNSIEHEYALEGKRKLNLDPGLLSAGNFILATRKNRSHRVPLSDGMYAEVTLMYMDKAFQSFPWTYADYKSEQFKALFKDFRREYLDLLKTNG